MSLMDDVKTTIVGFTPKQWYEFYDWIIYEENTNRSNYAAIQTSQVSMVNQMWGFMPQMKPEFITYETYLEDPETTPPWVNPEGEIFKMYIRGAVVEHNGAVWVSIFNGMNRWEPGTDPSDHTLWAPVDIYKVLVRNESFLKNRSIFTQDYIDEVYQLTYRSISYETLITNSSVERVEPIINTDESSDPQPEVSNP